MGHNGGDLDAALNVSEADIPIRLITITSCLTNAPAALAGHLDLGRAANVLGEFYDIILSMKSFAAGFKEPQVLDAIKGVFLHNQIRSKEGKNCSHN